MKILIIGCSQSLGSYALHANGDEEWREHYAWFNELTDEHEITAYVGYGACYIQYSALVDELADEIKNYDMVIIQETAEPKFQLTKNAKYVKHEFDNLTKYDLDKDTIILGRAIAKRTTFQEQLNRNFGLEITENAINYLDLIAEHDDLLIVSKMGAAFCNHKLREIGIPSYILCFNDKDVFRSENSYCKYIDVPDMETVFSDNPGCVNKLRDGLGHGHITRKGHNVFGTLVKNALREVIKNDFESN